MKLFFLKGTVCAVFFVLSFISPCFAQYDDWKIRAEQIDPANYSGATVANGIIGVVSSPHPFQVNEIILGGAFDPYGRGRVNNRIRAFNFLSMFLEVDRHRIGPGNVSNMSQVLDMRNASFSSSFDFKDIVTVKVTYRALRQLPYSVLMEVEVKAKKAFVLNTGSVMESPDALKNVRNVYNEITIPGGRMSLLSSIGNTPSGKIQVAASNSFLFENNDTPEIIYEALDDNLHQIRFHRNMKKGEIYRYAIVGSSISSVHHPDPANESDRLTIYARQQGLQRLITLHESEWSRLWQSDIEIKGDAQVQKDVRLMIYHLYSFLREDTNFSISPMGLSSSAYNGHVFWDAEIWMFPAILVLHPELAKSIIDYRYERLQAAKDNAKRHGYKGAMFPWESAGTGDEDTPIWALSGPFEHHITACIGVAAWNYFTVTKDTVWLKQKGWPILSTTAEFWMSRVEENKDGYYDIKNVVGADEWAENIDNDAWTNAVTKENLRCAAKASFLIHHKNQSEWLAVADKIRIMKFNSGVTREHASYNGEPVKQADVNLLAYPLNEITDTAQILSDLKYYKERIPDLATPAMTKAVFALLYAKLGFLKESERMFYDSYVPNKTKPFGMLAETRGGGNPYFVTGAGGVLQCVMMGFGGIRITDEGVIQGDQRLLPKWKELKIKIPTFSPNR